MSLSPENDVLLKRVVDDKREILEYQGGRYVPLGGQFGFEKGSVLNRLLDAARAEGVTPKRGAPVEPPFGAVSAAFQRTAEEIADGPCDAAAVRRLAQLVGRMAASTPR